MTARSPGQRYPIRAVARMTGLSIDTLRAWERRYAAVVPRRGERGRVYTDDDVSRLKQLAILVERGHAIGTVAPLSVGDLSRLIDGSDALTARHDDIGAVDLTAVLQALDRYDLPAIESSLTRHAALLPIRELVFAVVLPLLRELGGRWERGALSPAQEHLVSNIVRSALGSLLRSLGSRAGATRVVFATPAGERHDLCLLCAGVLAANEGYAVLYLGPDLPAADIKHAVANSGASSVVLAATTPGAITRTEARQLARDLSGEDVWVGGPQASELVSQMGVGRAIHTLEALLPALARHRLAPDRTT